jgi:hypothetical protein
LDVPQQRVRQAARPTAAQGEEAVKKAVQEVESRFTELEDRLRSETKMQQERAVSEALERGKEEARCEHERSMHEAVERERRAAREQHEETVTSLKPTTPATANRRRYCR